MENFIKVAGHDGLVRDRASGAIVNTDRAGYQAYIQQRDALMRRQQQIDENTQDIKRLSDDMTEIKQMLKLLLNK
jgi:hypothetical protein